jgi:hypothetical protein
MQPLQMITWCALLEREADMNENQNSTGRGYWLGWFLASVLGYGLGAMLGFSLIYNLSPTDTFDATRDILSGTVMGVTGGYFQWMVLTQRLGGTGLWGLASALGFGTAMAASAAVSPNADPALAGFLIVAVFGVVGGILQWLILRRNVPRAGWWLLASLLGSLLGAIGPFTAVAISETGNWGLALMAFGVIFGAANGAITGAALVWLLRQSPSGEIKKIATAH